MPVVVPTIPAGPSLTSFRALEPTASETWFRGGRYELGGVGSDTNGYLNEMRSRTRRSGLLDHSGAARMAHTSAIWILWAKFTPITDQVGLQGGFFGIFNHRIFAADFFVSPGTSMGAGPADSGSSTDNPGLRGRGHGSFRWVRSFFLGCTPVRSRSPFRRNREGWGPLVCPRHCLTSSVRGRTAPRRASKIVLTHLRFPHFCVREWLVENSGGVLVRRSCQHLHSM